jgi:hypothetical protein
MKQPQSEHRDSALWRALDSILTQLSASGEVAIGTAPDYVIAHICRELAAKRLITEAGLRNPRRQDASP